MSELSSIAHHNKIIIDISRLLFRGIKLKPRGIDRVILAYIRYYQTEARLLVVIWGCSLILSKEVSNKIIKLLLSGGSLLLSKFVVGLFNDFLFNWPKRNFDGYYLLKFDYLYVTREVIPPFLTEIKSRGLSSH